MQFTEDKERKTEWALELKFFCFIYNLKMFLLLLKKLV
jgi:hypothetical protein